jgi:hemerythrin
MLTPAFWSPDYSVGHPVLDEQHRKLLAICSALAALIGDDSTEGDRQFHAVLHELATYADTHFRTEETLLRKYHYPHLIDQIGEHDDYRNRLTEIFVAATHGVLEKARLHAFLAGWWVGHILDTDMAYKSYLQELAAPDDSPA